MKGLEEEELILDDRYDEHGRKKKKENTILVNIVVKCLRETSTIIQQLLLYGKRLSEKLPRRSPYLGFYCIFINRFFENLPGGWGAVSSPPVCIYDL
jgi:hypothetical protein